MLAYMNKNKEWCTIPDQAIENATQGHARTAQTASQACGIAEKMKKAQEQQANGGAATAEASRWTPLTPTAQAAAIPGKTTRAEALPDARPDHPVWRFAPPSLRPYIQLARLDRPIGWWLLLLPCWWSSALATSSLGRSPNLLHLVLLLIGAIAMRGAGSTYNDIVDRDIDARVERTRNRPLASGRLRARHALALARARMPGRPQPCSFPLTGLRSQRASPR